MTRRFDVRFADVAELEKELEGNWRHGRAFVSGVTGLDPFMPCELALHHPAGGEPLVIGATVTASTDDQAREQRVRFLLDDGLEDVLREFVARTPDASSEPPVTQSGAPASLPPAARLKQLPMADQIKLARTSPSLTERTVLERMLGKTAWEQLLSNPLITPPEIARIARKGTVPRPMLERIVDNATWRSNAVVRRALLSNPKLSRELIAKVLRNTPGHELKLVPKQTAYPAAVRDVARRLLGGGA